MQEHDSRTQELYKYLWFHPSGFGASRREGVDGIVLHSNDVTANDAPAYDGDDENLLLSPTHHID